MEQRLTANGHKGTFWCDVERNGTGLWLCNYKFTKTHSLNVWVLWYVKLPQSALITNKNYIIMCFVLCNCLGNYLQETFWKAGRISTAGCLVPENSGSAKSKNNSFSVWDPISQFTRITDHLEWTATKLRWGPMCRGAKWSFIYRRTKTHHD